MEGHDRAKPRPRLRRVERAERRPFRLSARDLEILRHLAAARVLSSSLIARLVTFGQRLASDQVVVRRLRDLYDHGLVDRLIHQEPFLFSPDGLVRGTGRLVYALSAGGARLLAQHTGDASVAAHRWDKNNHEAEFLYIQHELQLATVYTAVTLAARTRPDVTMDFWRQGHELRSTFFTDAGGHRVPASPPGERRDTQAHTVYPDAFFALVRTNPTSGQEEALYCLVEADRSTEGHAKFQRKLENYARWRALGVHREAFGVPDFVVLTVTVSAARRDSLANLARQTYDWKRDPALFRFATQGDLPLDEPQRLFGPVWRTPGDTNFRRLLTDVAASATMPLHLPQLTQLRPQPAP